MKVKFWEKNNELLELTEELDEYEDIFSRLQSISDNQIDKLVTLRLKVKRLRVKNKTNLVSMQARAAIKKAKGE